MAKEMHRGKSADQVASTTNNDSSNSSLPAASSPGPSSLTKKIKFPKLFRLANNKSDQKVFRSLEHRISCEDKKLYPCWGYSLDDGPEVWSNYYPDGLGRHQSPINIETAEPYVVYDESLSPITFGYNKSKALSIWNSGHSFQVKFDQKSPGYITGGPLMDAKYYLVQMHAHWGTSNKTRGSEHTIDGRSFPAELHFVHFNKDKYESIAEAMRHHDGISIVAVFLKVSQNPKRRNEELQSLIEDFNLIDYDNHDIPLDFALMPRDLIPLNSWRYFTYNGSLTTPPLSECVTWIVMADPLEVSDDQLAHFHDLHSPEDGHLIDHNFRPVQPVNDRIVRASFADYKQSKQDAPIFVS